MRKRKISKKLSFILNLATVFTIFSVQVLLPIETIFSAFAHENDLIHPFYEPIDTQGTEKVPLEELPVEEPEEPEEPENIVEPIEPEEPFKPEEPVDPVEPEITEDLDEDPDGLAADCPEYDMYNNYYKVTTDYKANLQEIIDICTQSDRFYFESGAYDSSNIVIESRDIEILGSSDAFFIEDFSEQGKVAPIQVNSGRVLKVRDVQFRKNNSDLGFGIFVDGGVLDVIGVDFSGFVADTDSQSAALKGQNGSSLTIERSNLYRNDYGIHLSNQSSANVVDGNTFVANAIGIFIVDNASARIVGNNFENNGVAVRIFDVSANTVSVSINNNTITTDGGASDVGIEYSGGEIVVDATNNWWGDCSGPNDNKSGDGSNPDTNPSGQGNRVIGKVDYSGFDNWDQCVIGEVMPPKGLIEHKFTHEGDSVLGDGPALQLTFNESSTADVNYQYEYISWNLSSGQEFVRGISDLDSKVCAQGVCTFYRFFPDNQDTVELGRVRATLVEGTTTRYSDWSNWNDLDSISELDFEDGIEYSNWVEGSGVFGRSDYIEGEGGIYIVEDEPPVSYVSSHSGRVVIPTTMLTITVDSYIDDYTEVDSIDVLVDKAVVGTVAGDSGDYTLNFPGNGTYCINTRAEDIVNEGVLDNSIGNIEEVEEGCDLEVRVDYEELYDPIITDFASDYITGSDSIALTAVSFSQSFNIAGINYQIWNDSLGINESGDFSGDFGSGNSVRGDATINGVANWPTGYYNIRVCGEDTRGVVGQGDYRELPTIQGSECYVEVVFIENYTPPPVNHAPDITNSLSDRNLKEGSRIDDTFTVEDADGNLEGFYYYIEQYSGIPSNGYPRWNAYEISGGSYTTNFASMLGMNRVDTSLLNEGNYEIFVEVWDSSGVSDYQVMQFEVENDDPDIEDLESNYTHVYEGTKVKFEAEFEDDSDIAQNPDDAEWYMEVDYDDGDEYKKTGIDDTGDLDIKSHRFDKDGVYEVEVKVCEAEQEDNYLSENECDTEEITIYVYNYVPVDPVDPEEESEEEITEEVPEEKQIEEEEGEVLGEDACEPNSKVKVFGYVYNDANQNSVYDGGEPGAGSVEVKLLKDVNGTTETIATTQTDDDGYWEMMSCEGSYKVQIDSSQLPSGTKLESLQTQSVLIDDEVSNQVDFQFSLKNNILNWLTQNCLWVILGVLALVLLVILAVVVVKSGDNRGY
ncbi:hypothetical protein GF357_04550 [Candidatus Dojkabacteria bacterium]|nr:hypothetical protein [Candidatus Dojkabacteria bacterium]